MNFVTHPRVSVGLWLMHLFAGLGVTAGTGAERRFGSFGRPYRAHARVAVSTNSTFGSLPTWLGKVRQTTPQALCGGARPILSGTWGDVPTNGRTGTGRRRIHHS